MRADHAPPPAAFVTTHWTQVKSAQDWEKTQGREALDRLMRAYQKPLLRFLEHQFKVDEHKAWDWLQEFVKKRILEKNHLKAADPARGRFRSFLIISLKNFVLNELRSEGRMKLAPLDESQAARESASEEVPPEFDILWAQEVLRKAFTGLEETYRRANRLDLWDIFERGIRKPALDGENAPKMAELFGPCGFASAPEGSAGLITAKRRFGSILRSVVAEYAGGPEEVEAELGHLVRVLESGAVFKSWASPS